MPPELALPDAVLAEFGGHYRGLLRFLTRRTGCAEQARELVHDTWLRLAERRQRGAFRPASAGAADLPEGGSAEGTPPWLAHASTPPRDARAYLYTVAANLAANLHRRGGRSAQRFAGFDEGGADPCAAVAADGSNADIAGRHALREAVGAVDAALQALPARRRQIFLDHRLDGEPHAALAERHGVSVKTIEREVRLATRAAEAALRRWAGEPTLPAPPADGADAAPAAHVSPRRRVLAGLFGGGALAAGGAVAWRVWRHDPVEFSLALATPVGVLRRQPLPDGSVLTLDAASRAEVAMGGDRRLVRLLEGGAFFEVAGEPGRPFRVEAPWAEAAVEVAGAGGRFCVERLATSASGSCPWLQVEGGEVAARFSAADAGPVVVREGQALRLGATGAAERPQPAAAPVASWREGWLDFPGVPLGDVVARLQRYHATPIRVAPAAGRLSVLGRVRLDAVADWLRLLPRSLPVRLRTGPGGTLRIEPR